MKKFGENLKLLEICLKFKSKTNLKIDINFKNFEKIKSKIFIIWQKK